MQYYVCNGQIPTETQDEGYTAFIEYMDSGAEMVEMQKEHNESLDDVD